MNQLYRSKLGARLVFLFFIFTVPVYGQGHVEIIENAKTKNFNELVQLVEAYYADKDKGKGSGYKQFKRWEYFHSTRLDENGNVVNVAQRNLEAAGAKKQTNITVAYYFRFTGQLEKLGTLGNGT